MSAKKCLGILLVVVGAIVGQAAFVATLLFDEMGQAVETVTPLLDDIQSLSAETHKSLVTLQVEMNEISPQKQCKKLVKSGPIDSIDRPVCALKPAIGSGIAFTNQLLTVVMELKTQFQRARKLPEWVTYLYILAVILIAAGVKLIFGKDAAPLSPAPTEKPS